MPIPTADAVQARYDAIIDRATTEAAKMPPSGAYVESDEVAMRHVQQTTGKHIDMLPRRYATAALEDLKATQQPALLQAWMADRDALTLWMFGGVGTGKTYAAAALFLEFVARDGVRRLRGGRGNLGMFTSLAALIDSLRGDGGDDAWRRAKNTPFLVLDDFAHIRPTDWGVERVWMLADHRVNAGLRTVITTNAAFDALRDVWGAGTMDRLTEAATSVTITGASQRKPFTFGAAQ